MSSPSYAPTANGRSAKIDRSLPDLLDQLSTALRKAQANRPELPPILSVSTNGEFVAIQPWLAGAPLTALLEWEKAMAPQVDRRATRLALSDGSDGGFSTVTSTGVMHGVPVSLTASTHRRVPTIDSEGRCTATALMELATGEEAITAEVMERLMRGIDDDPEIDAAEKAAAME